MKQVYKIGIGALILLILGLTIVVKNMVEKMKIPEDQARQITQSFLPKLVRWNEIK